MNILITGTGFNNKGAELMFLAVVEHLRQNFPNARMAGDCFVSDGRMTCSLYRLANRAKGKLSILFDYLPERTVWNWGFLRPCDIDVVIDASGYCFSDLWSDEYVEGNVNSRIAYHRFGAKLVLLPQAFGPFQRAGVRKSCKSLFEKSSLIFPRDLESFEHVRDLTGSDEKLHLAHDFTNIVQGFVPQSFDPKLAGAIGILPNEKMIAKKESQKENYLDFLVHCFQILTEYRVPYFLLCHQNEDYKIVELLKSKWKTMPPVVSESNPLFIKGILGTCRFLIGSRFHGLINGFSQGIPCIGTSWSHKYEALFKDYGCSEFLMTDLESKQSVNPLIASLMDDSSYQSAKNNIEKHATLLKTETQKMWGIVDDFLNPLS